MRSAGAGSGGAGHSSGGDGRAGGLWAPEHRGLTVGLLLTVTLVASEALAVVTIMPEVARDLGGLRLYGWVFSAFLLGSMVGIVAAGREADRFGPARPYVAGLVLFSAGLLVGGLAPSMAVLVVGRTLQGLGAGAVPAVAYVAIGRSLPEQLRARMMALLSTAWVVPGLVGPLAAAAVARLFGWRWVFIGLVPLVAVTGVLALGGLTRLGRPARTPELEHRIIDAVCAAAGAGLFVAGLSEHNPTVAVVTVLVGAALLVPALVRLLPGGTLRARSGLPATVLVRGLLTFAFFGADSYVTLALVTVRHQSIVFAGVALTCATITWTLGAWVQARLNQVTEGRRLIRIGLVLILAGIGLMLLVLRPEVPVALAFAAWAVAGLGMGIAYAPTSLMMLREAPDGREGWASASLSLADVLGAALGTGVGGAAVATAAGGSRPLTSGVAVAFVVPAAVGLVAIWVTGRLPLGFNRAAGPG